MAINILGEKDPEVPAWIRKKQPEMPVLVGTDLPRLRRDFGVTGAPETFILDREGRIFSWHVGYEPGEEESLEAEVRLVLDLTPFP